MSKHVALNAFLAMGMTFVIVTGGIDLSVGSIVGLCAMVAGGLILNGLDLRIGYTVYFNVVEVIGITLCVGLAIGALNGVLITRLNVAPFHRDARARSMSPAAWRCCRRTARRFPISSARRNSARPATAFSAPGRLLGLPVVDLDPDRRRAGRRLFRALHAARPAHLRRRRQ